MKSYICKHNLSGELSVPGSKSHTIRAALIATMAQGESVIRNPLASGDTLAATKVASAFGAKCRLEDDNWTIAGVGSRPQVPDDIINIDNSGTTLYLSMGLAGHVPGWTVFTGDKQIRRRSVRELLDTLKTLGAAAFATRTDADAAPVVIKGPLHGGDVTLNGKYCQFVSSVLLTAPLVDGRVRVTVEDPKETSYVAMTIDWMKKTGIQLTYDAETFKYFEIDGPQAYHRFDAVISSDWSGVAFPLCGAVITNSAVTINNVNFDDVQGDSKIVDVLLKMGADITADRKHIRLVVRGGKTLEGITVDLSEMPDSLPALSVVACFANGTTRFEGVGMIRKKETDRIAVMKEVLTKMGAEIEDEEEAMIIHGGRPLSGTLVESYDDHRVAMALALAGLAADGETIVNDAECVGVSFPNFYEVMNSVGAGFVVK
jgi:3-phosphoshikimate 1-carboxyvinyltransferase